MTPSGNIECSGASDEAGYIQCVLRDVDFVTQPKPADCETDWVNNEINLANSVTTLGQCRGDVPIAVLNPRKAVLKYGTVNIYNGIRCFSETRGLSCWEGDSEHGFFVSKSVFAVF